MAQPVGFGVIGGFPATDYFSTSGAPGGTTFGISSNTHQYLVGLDFEARMPLGLGLELNAMYHPISYQGIAGPFSENFTAHTFEFPAMVKYRLPTEVMRPYIVGGVDFSTLYGVSETYGNTTAFTNTSGNTNVQVGAVGGVGLDLKLAMVHIAPEARYIHWNQSAFVDPTGYVHTGSNQVEILLGVTF